VLKCIPCSRVILGMHIHKLDGPWIGHGFWRSSFLLEREEDLQRLLKSQVQRVWIDTAKGCDEPLRVLPAPVTLKSAGTARPVVPAPMEMKAEMARAVKVCAVAKHAVISMFSDLRMGQAVDVRQVASLVEEISRSMLRHPHALLSLVRLKKANEYTYMHSVAVSGLMIALARQLGLSPAKSSYFESS
jgi:HD-GYP domain-containing protein (c-di-GMP phosphodiesterase class II)